MKILLLLVVLGAAVAWLARGRRKPPPPPPASARPPQPRALQSMVSCAHCGLHLPEVDALPGPDGGHYCSEAHRRAGPRGQG